jgi:hypothetical protein
MKISMELHHNLPVEQKIAWGLGPWIKEPDFMSWRDPSGLKCVANRNQSLGNWCGYVGVSYNHKMYEMDYADADLLVNVHGGLTYSGGSDWDTEIQWFGFDCGHFMDICPGTLAIFTPNLTGKSYRDMRYIFHEVNWLAAQLRELA